MSYYKIEKHYPWLYSIHDPGDVYCYLIVGQQSAILFDTGFGVGSLGDAIAQVCDKPYRVILSHGHVDHVNGAYQFDEAWIHPKDYPVFKEHTSKDLRRDIINNDDSGFPAQEYINANTDNLRELEYHQIFSLGGLTVEVIPMEGHTAGSVGLFVREHKVLLCSDAASKHVWLFLDESLPVSAYVQMLRRVKELDFNTFFVGHSNVPYPKSDFDRFIHAATNIDPSKATPFDALPEKKGLLYKEDDIEIVIRPD